MDVMDLIINRIKKANDELRAGSITFDEYRRIKVDLLVPLTA